jgi:hypothetical protein
MVKGRVGLYDHLATSFLDILGDPNVSQTEGGLEQSHDGHRARPEKVLSAGIITQKQYAPFR